MSDPFRDAVRRLSHVPGVSGAMVVDANAGVAVAEELTPEVSGTAIGALAGALFSRTSQASLTAGLGELETVQLGADSGHVLIAGAGELIVVALVSDDAQIGRVRMEAQRAAVALRVAMEPGT
jgi:predicted regulator of Ras-like GTPase activity (Roadblock/LC7/MglB family)